MTQDQQKQQKKKSKKKHRTGGLGKLRKRNGYCDPKVWGRAKALNQAHLRGVPSFLYPPPRHWQPPKPATPPTLPQEPTP